MEMNNRNLLVIFLLIFILILGTGLRFINLDKPSIWIDELNHFYAAKSINETGKPVFPSGFPNIRAELYSKIVALSLRVFGENEFGLRFPSALFGVICIILIYFIALRFFDRRTALLSALFLAISPFAIGWSRLSRMYTLFQILFVIGSYMFYLGFENQNRGWFYSLQNKLLDKIKLAKIGRVAEKHHINFIWLILSLVPFYFSYRIHDITMIFLVGVWFYLVFMSLVTWRKQGFETAYRSKYFFFAVTSLIFGLLAIILSVKVRSFLAYAINYFPKWAEGTRFQDRKLYLDFIFNDLHFPVGVLFVIGVYQIFARMHKSGIFITSLFFGYFFMFTFVFSYRHFQYLYNVYSFFVIIAAFAYSNIIDYEYERIKQNWFSRTRLKPIFVNGIIILIFLSWIPFTPSVRLARRIPFIKDGGYNGAMYMEEWREACNYVKDRINEEDIVISTDALGTRHYLGKIDYDLNLGDLEIAISKDFKNDKNEYRDIYSGAKLIIDLNHFKKIVQENQKVWLLVQHYKLYEARSFVSDDVKDFIFKNFKLVKSTSRNTVDVLVFDR